MGSGKYQFRAAGGIPPAEKAYKTSTPPDRSVNPEAVDLDDATVVAQWKLAQEGDLKQWAKRNNVEIQQTDGATWIVATGGDPQLEIRFAEPVAGPLVLALQAQPAAPTDVQFFWAEPGTGYREAASNRRQLNASETMQQYLFRLENDKPIQQLRFDPLSGAGQTACRAAHTLSARTVTPRDTTL